MTSDVSCNKDAPTTAALPQVLESIKSLPEDWHGAGAIRHEVLEAIVSLMGGRTVKCTAETGAGKSTLLLSHLSERHIVFSIDSGGSISAPRQSPLCRADHVEWVEGPTQVTLPAHAFTEQLDLVLLDGPHAYPFPDLEYYYLYPHLAAGGLLIVDDIWIPTIGNLHNFLKEDEMFEPVTTLGKTAFFRRTSSLTFPTRSDGWWLQNYNRQHMDVGRDLKLKAVLSGPTQGLIGSMLKAEREGRSK
jgi:hypothetical protein